MEVMDDVFEVASGSVIGRDHMYVGTGRRKVLVGKNNQDSHYAVIFPDYIVAVVCDGCGSSYHSEVGSKIGARLLIEAIRNYLLYHPGLSDQGIGTCATSMLERVRQDTLAQIRVLAAVMGPSLTQIVSEYFLFTIVGALVTRFGTVIFSIGDGVYFVNGSMTEIGPFLDDSPPYMAYGITGSPLTNECPGLLHFQVDVAIPTKEVGSILIGVDGVLDLINIADHCIPGREDLVGPINQFWEDDRYFANPFAITRRLSLINRDHVGVSLAGRRVEDAHGELRDDTTFVVIRRRGAYR